MSDELRPFAVPRRDCPKCTAGEQVMRWLVTWHDAGECPRASVEHLCWRCSRCGYTFATATADA